MFERYFNRVMRMVEQMDMQDWGIALAAMILFGVVFLRGFGSRKDY